MITASKFVMLEGGVRLDAALLNHFPTTTRAFVREAIERGEVMVNGRNAAKGLKLKGGETIEIKTLLEACDNLVAPERSETPIAECYADDVLLAYDKPVGMPVQPLNCRETGTLMNHVAFLHPECRPLGDIPLMAGALHRIDADTSGLVLVARTADAFADLRAQFSAQTVKKTYLAMVEGEVAVGGRLENELVHDPTLPFCRMIDYTHNRLSMSQRAKLKPLPAVTEFEPLARTMVENEVRTLLKVTIYTGVTHQIRAQLALAGMHIINDRLYGAFAIEHQCGHFLHAYQAEFLHPTTHLPTVLSTDLPTWASLGTTKI